MLIKAPMPPPNPYEAPQSELQHHSVPAVVQAVDLQAEKFLRWIKILLYIQLLFWFAGLLAVCGLLGMILVYLALKIRSGWFLTFELLMTLFFFWGVLFAARE